MRSITILLAMPISLALAVFTSPTAAQLPPALKDQDYRSFNAERAALGQVLFYDKILSGNRNISCATCHHHDLATTDRLSLGIGEGGTGLGPNRSVGQGDDLILRRVPRNSPALFNLGAKAIQQVFHDGRLSADPEDPTGFNTPAKEFLPLGLANVVAAQTIFPLTSETEMAGQIEENEIAGAQRWRHDRAWYLIEERLRSVPAYVALFKQAYPTEIETGLDISITHLANAIGDFIIAEWRSDHSKFDAFLRGDIALSPIETQGLDLFFGKARCHSCHSGPLFSDHGFHAIAVPQFGPGRTRKWDPSTRDRGRLNETDDLADAYKFRTPMLRNVAETFPYGHTGAFPTLEAMIKHHLDPVASNRAYSLSEANLPKHPTLSKADGLIRDNAQDREALLTANELFLPSLRQAEIDALVAFLNTLTDPSALKGRLGKPSQVPSGLPLD